jgi:hypothetical protein
VTVSRLEEEQRYKRSVEVVITLRKLRTLHEDELLNL